MEYWEQKDFQKPPQRSLNVENRPRLPSAVLPCSNVVRLVGFAVLFDNMDVCERYLRELAKTRPGFCSVFAGRQKAAKTSSNSDRASDLRFGVFASI
jgi:hypothetical protein